MNSASVPERNDFPRELRTFCRAATGDHLLGSFAGKDQHGGPANASERSGDEDDRYRGRGSIHGSEESVDCVSNEKAVDPTTDN
jgi:hypothetical protein